MFLVGAGPGDPELLTLKAARILATAELLVYDRLVHPAVLALTPPEADRIPVGKRPGGPSTSQETIHQILITGAQSGLRVVRLQGGNPFLFGRGGEEVLALAKAGVPWEVVPGVSSALAAPLAARIPLTHRGLAATVVIASGSTADSDAIDWTTLGRLDGTLVFLMGMRALDSITTRLIAAGKDPSTPSAAVQWATWEEERVVRSSLASLAATCRRVGVSFPATVVVGPVVDLLPSPSPPPAAALPAAVGRGPDPCGGV